MANNLSYFGILVGVFKLISIAFSITVAILCAFTRDPLVEEFLRSVAYVLNFGLINRKDFDYNKEREDSLLWLAVAVLSISLVFLAACAISIDIAKSKIFIFIDICFHAISSILYFITGSFVIHSASEIDNKFCTFKEIPFIWKAKGECRRVTRFPIKLSAGIIGLLSGLLYAIICGVLIFNWPGWKKSFLTASNKNIRRRPKKRENDDERVTNYRVINQTAI